MDRREAIKVSTLLTLSAVSALAYDERLVVNKKKMKKDNKNPTKSQLKHTPDIKIGKVDENGYFLVEVTVGQEGIIHPSTKNHWIYNITLYANNKKICSIDLEPEISKGYLSAKVKKDGLTTLKAEASCNLHGTWENEIIF